MGDMNETWQDIYNISRAAEQKKPVPITLEYAVETSTLAPNTSYPKGGLPADLQSFVDAVNRQLESMPDKEIMVYVHGTKVDFANSAILAAEVDHFAGRDFVALAFAWPSHQNILSYLIGVDVHRALDSAEALGELLAFLAEHTRAKKINILSYSAGGKVATRALSDLREQFSQLDSVALRSKLRCGSIVFAAIDVNVDVFLHRLKGISELCEQVVLTVTDDDNALKAAKKFMGGEVRAGSADAEQIEEQFIVSRHLSNVEIIDVSLGKEVRGFDITGHHYWYRHPWMSSDIIFLMRTNLPPARRGLSATEMQGIWYLSADYPEKIRQAAATELEGQW
ncbi:MAG: alpha/beta hydrolase [Desulforhopalus sp.]